MPSRNSTAVITRTPGAADNNSVWSGKDNAHWHDYDAVEAINRTGVQLVLGDVVAWSTANDGSVVVNDVVGSHQPFVVAQATIANVAAGELARAGRCTVKAQGVIDRGAYIRKSATAKAVESTGVSIHAAVLPPDGAIGFAIAPAAGGFVTARLFGFTVATPVLLLAGPAAAIVNTAVETSVLSLSIPGGTTGLLGAVRMSLRGRAGGRSGGGGSILTWRFKFGGTTVATIGQVPSVSSLTADEPWWIDYEVAAANATNQQRAFVRIGTRSYQTIDYGAGNQTKFLEISPSVYRGTAAVDLTAAQVMEVTAQWGAAHADNTLTLEHGQVLRVVP